MRNWCSDQHPRHAACQVVYRGSDGREHNANNWHAPGLHLADMPMYHYGWCRNAVAMAISQAKHRAWYADGAGLEDGHIPEVKPYDFRLGHMIRQGRVVPWPPDREHPSMLESWFACHWAEWEAIHEGLRLEEGS